MLVLGAGKLYKCKDLSVEFKVPKQSRPYGKGGNKNTKASFGIPGYNLQIVVGVVRAPKLEDAREGIMNDLEKRYPHASARIKRLFTVGGMPAMTITISNLPSPKGKNVEVFNIVDVPVQGLVKLVVAGRETEREHIEAISEWLLPTFRLSGEEGEDLIFERRRVDTESGLSFRMPKGAVKKAEIAAPVIYEGQAPGGVYVKVDRPADAGDGSLKSVLKQWAGGAKAKIKPHKLDTQCEEGEAALAVYDPYGGRPERALVAFRPTSGRTFRIEVAGGKRPLLQAERIASVVNWLDIPALEAEVQGWLPKVEEAIKTNDERVLKKYGRRVADRFYLDASLVVARQILRKGPEKAQIYALRCIEYGGDPDIDFKEVKRAMTNSKFKDRTKMRVKGAEALGALVVLKCTNYLIQVARGDKDTKVSKAAALALGQHKANRKKIISFLIAEFEKALKDARSKSAKKKLRASRMGDAYRDALRSLTGQDLKEPKEARNWLRANQKILAKEQIVK